MKKLLTILGILLCMGLNAQIIINEPVTYKGKGLDGLSYKASEMSFNVQNGQGYINLIVFLDSSSSIDLSNSVDNEMLSYQAAGIPDCAYFDALIIDYIAKKYGITKENIDSYFCPE